MSDFLDGLERDLVKAMRKQEARRAPLGLVLPRFPWRPLAGMAAVVAAAVLAITVVAGRPGDSDRETPASAAVARLLADGTYARGAGDFQLIVSGGRYEILRCNGRDCGFDIFDEGVRGAPKVRTGAIERRGDLATFSADVTCRSGGPPVRGVYRVISRAGGVRFDPVSDPCGGRAAALGRSTWRRRP